jgi:hypothetical protein
MEKNANFGAVIMAITIPETIRTTATAGERLFFRTLKTYLPDDYIVYFEPEIQGRKPDFVIIGPDLWNGCFRSERLYQKYTLAN